MAHRTHSDRKTGKTPSRSDRRRGRHPRSSSGSSRRIALVVAVVGLVLIVLFILPRGQNQPVESVRSAAVMGGMPINNVDPTSGKPIVPRITSTYQGYTIGHCCMPSKGEFEALSPSQKDAVIRRFLK